MEERKKEGKIDEIKERKLRIEKFLPNQGTIFLILLTDDNHQPQFLMRFFTN